MSNGNTNQTKIQSARNVQYFCANSDFSIVVEITLLHEFESCAHLQITTRRLNFRRCFFLSFFLFFFFLFLRYVIREWSVTFSMTFSRQRTPLPITLANREYVMRCSISRIQASDSSNNASSIDFEGGNDNEIRTTISCKRFRKREEEVPYRRADNKYFMYYSYVCNFLSTLWINSA